MEGGRPKGPDTPTLGPSGRDAENLDKGKKEHGVLGLETWGLGQMINC